MFLSFGAGLWLLYTHMHGPAPSVDPSLKQVFRKVSAIKSYSQYVETEAVFPDRTLTILGTYLIDSPKTAFASYSTTTLLIQGDKSAHVFTHQNLAIGSDVYMKIETMDPVLLKNIQSSPDWRYFQSTEIPDSLSGIVVPGPIQDNVQILGQNGSWLSLVKVWGAESWGETSLLRYTFRLSGKKPGRETPLTALLSRIGPSGVVDAWIDPQTFEPRYLRFSNSTYTSTTTLRGINASPLIEAPILPKS